MGPHSSFEKVMSSNRKLAYNSKSRNQSRKQWNSTNTVQLCELFHFSTTSPQCFNTRKEKEGISLPTFISQTQKMFILHCVYQVLLTESNRKLWDIPAMSSENRKAVSTDQETSVLFSTLKKKKKIYRSGMHCDVCFLFKGPLSWYLLVFAWKSPRTAK